MKINSVAFKSYRTNELKKVIDISRKCGLSEQGVKVLLNEVKKVCPKKEDKVFFYFRKYYPNDYSFKPATIRSGVKVVKDGKTMELNIDPKKFQPKDLLQEMVMGVKKLVKGEVKPDEKTMFYPTTLQKSWISYYYDVENNLPDWFNIYSKSLKGKSINKLS